MDKKIEAFNEYFKSRVTDNIDRYGIPFETDDYKYFYDTGTGKVLQCDEPMFYLLCHLFENKGRVNPEQIDLTEEELKEAADELKAAMEEEHIFAAEKFERFICPHVDNFEELVGKECKQLILEVTEKCNLRCRYCIYGDETKNFRSFSMKNMTFDIAKKAMDYALTIAGDSMILAFYGGEPLIQYPLVRDCTEYFKEHYKGEEVSFVLTSNLTLLTEEMAEYFRDNQFLITCSLDGDEETHNQNRPYCGGKGSFDDTMRGLKLLVAAYGEDAKEHISINMVVDKPHTMEKFDRMDAFFHNLTWLPEGMNITTSYAGRDEWCEQTKLIPNIDIIKNTMGFHDLFGDWVFEKMRKEQKEILLGSMVKDALLDIHKRVIRDMPVIDCALNGCCVPGNRRLYVTVDGEFSACERIGNSPSIGNVEEGIDLERVKKYYIDDYMNQSLENCSNCWAVQLCGVCYARGYDKDGLDMKRKKMLCESARFTLYNALKRYHILLEECPEMLEAYNEIEIN